MPSASAGVKYRPILFDDEGIRGILTGRKVQDRRPVVPQPFPEVSATGPMWGHESLGGVFAEHVFPACAARLIPCPYGVPGDRLWVREAWRRHSHPDLPDGIRCRADNLLVYFDGNEPPEAHQITAGARWRPSVHMPRWASRITLELTAVRVERVQAISEGDVEAEGIDVPRCGACGYTYQDCREQMDHDLFCCGEPEEPPSAVPLFGVRWDALHAKRGYPWWWSDDPWVWVLEFNRCYGSVD